VAATLMVSAACRIKRDATGKTVRAKEPLIGPPFLMLCDYLLHRALFFGKSFYEQKVSAEARQAFLNMSRAAHTAPGAREDLQDCWKNHVRFRVDHKMQIAYGLPAGTADGLAIEDPDDEIARMEADCAEAVGGSLRGGAAAAGEGDGAQ
jgi:hypothetical protein